MKLFNVLLSFALLLFLSGCGQSGPLYLPNKPKPVKIVKVSNTSVKTHH